MKRKERVRMSLTLRNIEPIPACRIFRRQTTTTSCTCTPATAKLLQRGGSNLGSHTNVDYHVMHIPPKIINHQPKKDIVQ